MALTQCRACGHGVSRNAAACPNCGEPVKKPRDNYGTWGCLLIVIVMMGACFNSIANKAHEERLRHINDPNAWRGDDASGMAWVMICDFVEKQLRSPATADFPHAPAAIERDGQKYRIWGHVDSENAFGAMIRTPFRGEVEQIARDRWQLNELVFNTDP